MPRRFTEYIVAIWEFCYYAFNGTRVVHYANYIYIYIHYMYITYFVYFSAFYQSYDCFYVIKNFISLIETRWILAEIVEFGCKIDYVISNMFIKKSALWKV